MSAARASGTTATRDAAPAGAPPRGIDPERLSPLERDLLDGFWEDPPNLPPRWLYDERGSRLFDRITRLPEYYPTRAETAILRRHAPEIVEAAGMTTLVELGSGTSEKTRLLLGAQIDRLDRGRHGHYVPIDICAEMLDEAAPELGRVFPRLVVDPLVADFNDLPPSLPGADGDRLLLFLGGTIGNHDEASREEFLRGLSASLGPGDRVLIGFDLVKSEERLVAAYDDEEGVTAEFDLNLLDVINRGTRCAGVRRADFRHEARWNADDRRVEMWLVARRPVDMEFAGLGGHRHLDAGEGIRTEISRKFLPDELGAVGRPAGLTPERTWTDTDGDFALTLFVRS